MSGYDEDDLIEITYCNLSNGEASEAGKTENAKRKMMGIRSSQLVEVTGACKHPVIISLASPHTTVTSWNDTFHHFPTSIVYGRFMAG